jgi:hypothetical protein
VRISNWGRCDGRIFCDARLSRRTSSSPDAVQVGIGADGGGCCIGSTIVRLDLTTGRIHDARPRNLHVVIVSCRNDQRRWSLTLGRARGGGSGEGGGS